MTQPKIITTLTPENLSTYSDLSVLHSMRYVYLDQLSHLPPEQASSEIVMRFGLQGGHANQSLRDAGVEDHVTPSTEGVLGFPPELRMLLQTRFRLNEELNAMVAAKRAGKLAEFVTASPQRLADRIQASLSASSVDAAPEGGWVSAWPPASAEAITATMLAYATDPVTGKPGQMVLIELPIQGLAAMYGEDAANWAAESMGAKPGAAS